MENKWLIPAVNLLNNQSFLLYWICISCGAHRLMGTSGSWHTFEYHWSLQVDLSKIYRNVNLPKEVCLVAFKHKIYENCFKNIYNSYVFFKCNIYD